MAGQTISTAVSGSFRLSSSSNPLTVTSTGSIITSVSGDAVSGASGTAWQISNAGTISGTVGTSSAGMYLQGAGSSVDNSGYIYGSAAGIWLSSGGSVTNDAGGLIKATGNYGVYVAGAPGVVTNAGTITGSWYAVDLTFSSASNRVVVAPGAVFNGLVSGGNGTLELASGAGSGSITGLNTGSFKNFAALTVDVGASWTLSGSNTISSVTDNGTLVVTGALPASTYQIGAAGGGGVLEVASAPSAASPINFLGNSTLIIDSAAAFGTNVGSASYAGPLLGSFASGDTIDIKNFSATNASYSYDPTAGLLQIVNGTQTASLAFKTSTLGSGSFNLASDGGTGLNVTLSSFVTPPAAPTITSPASGSVDTTTTKPVISGGGISGDTVIVSIDGTVVGTATVSNNAWSYTPTTPLSNGSHSITATQAAAGGPSSAPSAADTFTVNVSSSGLTISSALTGPIALAATDNPVTITSTGSVKATASGANAIDGASGTTWSISNAGTVASDQHHGISLHGTGSSIVNSGSISGVNSSIGYGVDLEAGGSVTNTSTGTITGGEDAIFVYGAPGTISNSGHITSTVDDGIGLFGGGSVTNNVGGVIQAPTSGGYGPAAIYIPSGTASVVNQGSISGQYGVYLGVAGTVENAGTISGTSYAVDFAANSSANRLIVDPGAVFNGGVNGNGGVLELTAGNGSLGQIGSSAFSNFKTLIDDSNAFWTLTGTSTIANVTHNGALNIAGSLKVTASVDPASTGYFNLQTGGSLEVAADTAVNSHIKFAGSSTLVIDDVLHFGTNVGGSSYAGPLLESFGSGSSIDLHAFSPTGAALAYNASNGLLQVTNSSQQVATLDFLNPNLGSGFHFTSDGSGGLLVMV